jgi:hypothetical protein
MRAHRIILGIGLATGSIIATGQAALAQENQEYRGTMEQQMACTPDVWRLCSDQIPDVSAITACLRRNTPNLSDGCRAVFESNNSMPQSQAVPPPRAHNSPRSPQHIAQPSYDDDDGE